MTELQSQLEELLKLLRDAKNNNKTPDEEQLKKLDYFGMKGLEEGKSSEAQNRFADANLVYTQVIEAFQLANKPINPDYYFRRAYSYSVLKQDDKSMTDYLEYLKVFPSDAVAHNNMALLYCKKGMHDKEFELLEKAIKLDQYYDSPHRNVAVCYRDRKMFKEGLDAINKAIQLNPGKGVFYSIKGEVLEGLGKKEEAIECYEQALKLDSQDGFSRGQLNKLKTGNEMGLTSFGLEKPTTAFKDVVGLEEVKEWSKVNVLMPLSKPDLAKRYKKTFGGGMLLYGPPGCGKTYFCSALAGESKLSFIKVKLSGIFDMWLGNTEKNIANLFKTARKNKPCIIFFDEVDALGGQRTGEGHGNKWADMAVNQILMEITEIEEKKEEILVIGATNAPWNVDNALKRSGRLGKFVYIAPPNQEMRAQLFKMYLTNLPTEKKIDFEKLAKTSEDFAATDVKAVCEEATAAAFKEACKTGETKPITMSSLEAAIKGERSDLLEWYNSASKMIIEAELKEFYPELYEEINKLRTSKGRKSKTKLDMFR